MHIVQQKKNIDVELKKGEFARGVLLSFKDCYNKAKRLRDLIYESALSFNYKADTMDSCCKVLGLIWEKEDLTSYVKIVVSSIKKVDTKYLLTKKYLLNLEIDEIIKQLKLSRTQAYREITKTLEQLDRELLRRGISYSRFKYSQCFISLQILRAISEWKNLRNL